MKKHTKKIIIGLMSIAVLMIGFVVWLAIPGDTKQLEELASKFEPGSSWKENGKYIYPSRRICLEGNCDSLYYAWSNTGNFTSDDLSNFVNRAGFNFKLSGDCKPEKAPAGSGAVVCSAEGGSEDYHIVVDVTKASDNPTHSKIGLRINKI